MALLTHLQTQSAPVALEDVMLWRDPANLHALGLYFTSINGLTSAHWQAGQPWRVVDREETTAGSGLDSSLQFAGPVQQGGVASGGGGFLCLWCGWARGVGIPYGAVWGFVCRAVAF